jgi:hypothetical protein
MNTGLADSDAVQVIRTSFFRLVIRTSFFRVELYGICPCVSMAKWPQHLRDEAGLELSGHQAFSDSRFQYAFFFWDIERLVKVVKDEG